MDELVNQVAHWMQPRWSAGGRGARVHALVQRLADLAAIVEGAVAEGTVAEGTVAEGTVAGGGATRVVPRLDGDLVLPDQLRVVTVDLLALDPPGSVLGEALAAVRETRTHL